MLKIPESAKVITGDQDGVYDKIDCFFDEVQREVERTRPGGPFFERRACGLFGHGPTGVPTDDTIHMLLYRERNIATVTELRDDMNWVRFDFFYNIGI